MDHDGRYRNAGGKRVSIGREWKPARLRSLRDGTRIVMPASCVGNNTVSYTYVYTYIYIYVRVWATNRATSGLLARTAVCRHVTPGRTISGVQSRVEVSI